MIIRNISKGRWIAYDIFMSLEIENDIETTVFVDMKICKLILIFKNSILLPALYPFIYFTFLISIIRHCS